MSLGWTIPDFVSWNLDWPKWQSCLLILLFCQFSNSKFCKVTGLNCFVSFSDEKFFVKNVYSGKSRLFNLRSIIFAPFWWKVSQCNCASGQSFFSITRLKVNASKTHFKDFERSLRRNSYGVLSCRILILHVINFPQSIIWVYTLTRIISHSRMKSNTSWFIMACSVKTSYSATQQKNTFVNFTRS